MKKMANEAQFRTEILPPIDVTVADGAGIEKGTVMVLSDPRTSAANSGTGEVFGGIAASEKIASDGKTKLGAYFDGIFDMVIASGGSVNTGELVTTSGANLIRTATEAEIAAGKALGKALEDGTNDERVQVKLLGY